jgi:hypothetical protein
MGKRIAATVTTKNKKGFTHQGFEDADEAEIGVAVEVEIPETFEEAAGPEFYGSEQAVLTAVTEDWKRRCVTAARPILRESETELDWQSVAQTAVDSYKPGRKGGFAPKVAEEELDEKFGGEISDDLKAFLRSKGVMK